MQTGKYGRLGILLGLLFFIGLSQAGELTVSTDWLAKNLKSDKIKIIDMSDSGQYHRFHIPGAINVPYSLINKSQKGVSLSIGSDVIVKLLGQIGIDNTTHIILYDDTGGLYASRLFWELDRLGHTSVSIVDGGLVKWIREGRPVSAKTPKLGNASYIANKNKAQHRYNNVATLNDVKPGALAGKVLLDVRSKEEYQGNPKQKRSGHIPGSLWLEWSESVDFDKNYNIKSASQIQASLNKLGIKDKSQEIILYCRSGSRASHSYFVLRGLGYKNVKLYDASMKEYERYRQLPLKMGSKP